MTTRILSLASLRTFASSARRGHLAGSSWLAADRDLDRVAGDLLAVAHADPERLSAAPAFAAPVDLDTRRARSAGASAATYATTSAPRASAPHAKAS
ncbi:MAG: hypothetical protein ACKOVB_11595 [Terrabacter sp.]